MNNFKREICYLAAIFIIFAAFISCEEPIEPTVNTITLKTSSAKSFTLGLAGLGDVIIKWGDGTAIDTIKLSTTDSIYRYEYASEGAYDITITGSVTYLSVNYSNLTIVDATKCTTLEKLDCSYNKLSVLNAANCKVLKYLNCSNNNFSDKALNDLFGTLNGSAISGGKTIEIYQNAGCETCDREIARKKGWSVDEDCW